MVRLVELLVAVATLLGQGDSLPDDARSLARPRTARILAAGGVAATAAATTRDDWHETLHGDWYIAAPSDVTDIYGATSVNLPAALALWSGGAWLGSSGARDLGRDLTRTLTMTQIAVAPLKILSHRRRPNGSNHLSFPSGHAANAFAIARLAQRRHSRAALPLYGLAVMTAMGRMEGNQHYLSDVVMGAAVGLAVGSAVPGPRSPPGNRRVRLTPWRQGLRVRLAW